MHGRLGDWSAGAVENVARSSRLLLQNGRLNFTLMKSKYPCCMVAAVQLSATFVGIYNPFYPNLGPYNESSVPHIEPICLNRGRYVLCAGHFGGSDVFAAHFV